MTQRLRKELLSVYENHIKLATENASVFNEEYKETFVRFHLLAAKQILELIEAYGITRPTDSSAAGAIS